MYKLEIHIKADDTIDIENALKETVKRINKGNLKGKFNIKHPLLPTKTLSDTYFDLIEYDKKENNGNYPGATNL